MPVRLRRPYKERLKVLARAFGMSPGEWIEAQLEPHMGPHRTS